MPSRHQRRRPKQKNRKITTTIDHKSYPHLFESILNHTSLKTYLSMRALNHSTKQHIDNSFHHLIFTEKQFIPTSNSQLPRYIIELHTSTGYLITACRTRTPNSPKSYLYDGSKGFITTSAKVTLRRLANFLNATWTGPEGIITIRGDCNRSHGILDAMLSTLQPGYHPFPWGTLRIAPNSTGEIITRVPDYPCAPLALVFVDNWLVRAGVFPLEVGDEREVRFEVSGAERWRGGLVSTVLDPPLDLVLDFEGWKKVDGVEGRPIQLILEYIRDTCRVRGFVHCRVSLINLSEEVVEWLDPRGGGWDYLGGVVKLYLREQGIEGVLSERVVVYVPDGRFSLHWTLGDDGAGYEVKSGIGGVGGVGEEVVGVLKGRCEGTVVIVREGRVGDDGFDGYHIEVGVSGI